MGINYLNYFTVAGTNDGNILTAGPFETRQQAVDYIDMFKAYGNCNHVACCKASNKLDAGNQAAIAWEYDTTLYITDFDCEIEYKKESK